MATVEEEEERRRRGAPALPPLSRSRSIRGSALLPPLRPRDLGAGLAAATARALGTQPAAGGANSGCLAYRHRESSSGGGAGSSRARNAGHRRRGEPGTSPPGAREGGSGAEQDVCLVVLGGWETRRKI